MSHVGFSSLYGFYAGSDFVFLSPLMPACQNGSYGACSELQHDYPNRATWNFTTVGPCFSFVGRLADTKICTDGTTEDGVDVQLESNGEMLWSGTISTTSGIIVDVLLPEGSTNFTVKVDARLAYNCDHFKIFDPILRCAAP